MKTLCRFFSILLFIISISYLQPFTAPASANEVYYVKVDGIVNPVTAEFLTTSLKEASAKRAEVFIVQLDTPGGLDLSMRDIIKTILSSEVPVVVYVAPAGSRAASAGVFITYAANIAAMAPGTNIGSAHPVAMGGGKIDETMSKKIENDAVAYIKGIAVKRGRNADWAEKAVRESVNITAEDALRLHVIDLMADSREELLAKLDGRKAEVLSGEKIIKTQGMPVTEVEMDLRYRILSTITNPNVAYILLMIGLIGIYFELANPGAVFPGVIGAMCLILAFYAFQTLSINYAGLLLIVLSIILFIIEVKVVSYGMLTVAGVICLTLGSLMLFESPEPFMRLSIWVVLPTVVLMTGVILGTMYYALRIYRRKAVSGVEGLIGEEGTAIDGFDAGVEGKIFIDGEYWNAVSEEPIKKGDKVKVVELTGLLLKVKKQ
ncbi:MAG: nodulation protein NfeD [Deltaproteobacteria bacterium]|nr:nodulation protein NfeD [Deltaproteobacteria bacterium]